MRDEQLQRILKRINLDECEVVIDDYIYYIKKTIRSKVNRGDGTYYYINDENEFLIIAENQEKKAIILRCGAVDLHWHVLKKWRGQHVLSNALRTGVVNQVWPKNTTITCCLNYLDDPEEKFKMTQHLADIANLTLKTE